MYPNDPPPGTVFVMHTPPYLTTDPWFTHHPAQPDLPLRAGEILNKSDACWIGEDGQVWRLAMRTRRPDGIVMAGHAPGDPVRLYREVKGEVRSGYTIDELEYRDGVEGWGAYLRSAGGTLGA